MFRTTLFLCSVPAVFSIIVTDPPPSDTDYKYSYNIEDPSTGDSKSQHEVRLGDVVTGAYSVLGPDGTKRIVEYTADSKHGFKAVLREEPAQETHQSPGQESQQYYKYRNPQKPVAYTLAKPKLPISYTVENNDIAFFTPANEIKSDTILTVDQGKYFKPTYK